MREFYCGDSSVFKCIAWESTRTEAGTEVPFFAFASTVANLLLCRFHAEFHIINFSTKGSGDASAVGEYAALKKLDISLPVTESAIVLRTTKFPSCSSQV